MSQSQFQNEQLRLLNLIYEELQKLNANLARQQGDTIEPGEDHEELDSYE